jgi:hypothetical protein
MASPNSHTFNSSTAKDLFFKIPDLIEQTISHLQADNDKEYRLCLFNTALTCKDFLHPALDALWKELHSLMPLLKLLPSLQIEDQAYVCAHVLLSIRPHFVFRS